MNESQQEYCDTVNDRTPEEQLLWDIFSNEHKTKRFIVKESYGYGHRGGIRINETSAPRELAYSTVTGLIREYKYYAGGSADRITDVESAGWRLITAHHWINGFENIRVLHIQKSTVYNRIQLGME